MTVPENINTPPMKLVVFFVLDQPPSSLYPNVSYFPLKTLAFETPLSFEV